MKGARSGSADPFHNFTPHVISAQRLTLETSNFVRELAMRSFNVVMSECSLNGRGQGQVVGLFMTPI